MTWVLPTTIYTLAAVTVLLFLLAETPNPKPWKMAVCVAFWPLATVFMTGYIFWECLTSPPTDPKTISGNLETLEGAATNGHDTMTAPEPAGADRLRENGIVGKED